MAKRSSVKGAKDAAARFRQIMPGLTVPLNQASRAGLRPLLAEMRATVPVDSGDTKKALAIQRVKSPADAPEHRVGVRSGQEGSPASTVHLIEFGHAGSAPGSRFMTRAFEAKDAEVINGFKDAIGPAIRKRVAYLAKKAGGG
jgi:hypothetical protein